jgi:hypothetical protein
MANEHFIKPHLTYEEAGEHGKHHVSLASIRRREQEIDNMMYEWRTEQVIAADKRYGVVEGDQLMPFDYERLEEVRQELRGMCE